MRVIYMVEMSLDAPQRAAEWHEWYLRHIRTLLTVPGFRASQRFESVVATLSPFVALHEVASASVLESPAYHAVGGRVKTGEWQHLMSSWHRNLLEGLDETPEVPSDGYLLVIDEARDLPLPAAAEVHWVRAVGLDRSVQERGLAIVRDRPGFETLAKTDKRVRLLRPISGKLRAAATV
jgi:hypothetical protein